MNSNRTFYEKALNGEYIFSDIFDEVFKSHSEEEKSRTLISGTSVTTPSEKEMLSTWQKPFLFTKVFFLLAAVAALSFITGKIFFDHPGGYINCVIILSLLVPVTLLTFTWEMNIPRTISLYDVLKIVVLGGLFSVLTSLFFYEFDTNNALGSEWAPLFEEFGKFFIIYFILMRKDRKYILEGVLIGMAVGVGFEVIENLYYDFGMTFNINLISGLFSSDGDMLNSYLHLGMEMASARTILALESHGVFAALYGGAIVMAKGKEKISISHLFSLKFLGYFAFSFAVHFLHNSEIGADLGGIDFGKTGFAMLYYKDIALSLVSLIVFLTLISKGVKQVVEEAKQLNNGRLTMAVNRKNQQAGNGMQDSGKALYVELIEGPYAGKKLRFSDGQRASFGRVDGKCDVALPMCSNVSSLHCAVSFSGGVAYLIDEGSSNGTFVNGKRIAPKETVQLPNGARVSLGSEKCVFTVKIV